MKVFINHSTVLPHTPGLPLSEQALGKCKILKLLLKHPNSHSDVFCHLKNWKKCRKKSDGEATELGIRSVGDEVVPTTTW